MEAIYVLSDPDSIVRNKYKIGITRRTKELLLRDYRRSRPEVQLYLFEECFNSKEIETLVLNKLEKYRIKHESGNLSEWVQIELPTIISIIRTLLKDNKVNHKLVEAEPEYSIANFIRDRCNLTRGTSTSCQGLYIEYTSHGGTLTKMNFCKSVLKEIVTYYKTSKENIKFKKDKLTYYKDIQLKTVVSTQTCTII